MNNSSFFVVGKHAVFEALKNTKRKVFTGEGTDYEFESHWNGFEDLVTVYIREGNETVKRYRTMVSEGRVGAEYLDYASELEEAVTKWMKTAMKEIARTALAA